VAIDPKQKKGFFLFAASLAAQVFLPNRTERSAYTNAPHQTNPYHNIFRVFFFFFSCHLFFFGSGLHVIFQASQAKYICEALCVSVFRGMFSGQLS
jgi:hypothetical protein